MIKTTRGFTLIEFVIVIAIFAVISVIASLLLNAAFTSYVQNKQSASVSLSVDTAMERMSREMRDAVDITSSLPASSIIFTNSRDQSIQYAFSGSTITRQVNANPSQPLINNISAVTFSEFTDNSVTYITIDMDFTRSNGTLALRTTVHPRNLS